MENSQPEESICPGATAKPNPHFLYVSASLSNFLFPPFFMHVRNPLIFSRGHRRPCSLSASMHVLSVVANVGILCNTYQRICVRERVHSHNQQGLVLFRDFLWCVSATPNDCVRVAVMTRARRTASSFRLLSKS